VRRSTASFVRHQEAASDAPHFAGLAHGDPAVSRAQEFIHIRDGQGLSLDAIAAEARLGRRTLLRRFAAATGLSPVAYCQAVRLARARELLGAGWSIKEVAASLGYADAGSFGRAFRRIHGEAPGASRAETARASRDAAPGVPVPSWPQARAARDAAPGSGAV
jgi:transcriptional regulator GlxA family with amidase domain